MKARLAVVVVGGVLASGLIAPAAHADFTYSQPIPATGCTLHTRVVTDVDPQRRPPIDPSGTNVGYTCP